MIGVGMNVGAQAAGHERTEEPEESVYVERAQAGDLEAFRILVERYQKKAHSIAYGVIGKFEDAEDITQEAFVKAFRSLKSFRGQSSFYTWLYRIVYNMAIDHSRRRYRKAESSVGESDALEALSHRSSSDMSSTLGHAVTPDERFAQVELGQQLRKAISQLSPVHRSAIMLREVDGLSYEEMSRVMGCSKGTVMSRLFHARKKLQASLQPYMEA
jgi:RNA polymerase sigma-70 factor (ECF subfamily)